MKGQTIVELLLVIGLSAIILPALLTGLVASRSGKAQQNQRLQAVAILKETEEAVRNVRENDWNTFAVNGAFHPRISISGTSWELAPGSETTPDGFTRSIVISNVERDANGVIVPSAGTVDPSSKKLVITISWGMPLSTSIQSTIYLMRLDNITYSETTEAQFNAGTKTSVSITNTSGGEIILGSGGLGDWCQPTIPSGSLVLDLPKNGVANALTAIEGEAFAGTGDNASGVSFAKINIGNNPPNPNIEATFDGYKTNAVFGEEEYAYLATDNNSKEIVIIDLDNIVSGKYQEVGNFNAPGNGNGNSVFVSGNIGYMTEGDKLYSFDVSNKSSPTILDPDGLTLAGTGNKVVVNGNYAYVAVDSTTTQLQIIDVSNPSNMSIVGQASVGNSATLNFDGTDDRVTIPDSPSLRPPSTVTVTAWIKPDVLSSFRTVVDKRKSGSADSYVLGTSSSQVRFCAAETGTQCAVGGNLSVGTWQHLVGTYDGTITRAYINGVEVASFTWSNPLSYSAFPVLFGTEDQGGTLKNRFDGIIDEVRVYNRVLTPAEITSHYSEGVSAVLGSWSTQGLVGYWSLNEGTGQTVSDSSGNNNNGTLGASVAVGSDDPTWILTSNQGATDVFVNQSGSRAYLAIKNSTENKEFFIIDISIKTGNRPTLGTYDTNGMNPKGVTVVTNNKAIIAGSGAEEYQVIDITDESTPNKCGGLNVDSGINGVASVLEGDGDAYSYIITGDATAEFKIIAGGAGGGAYASAGTFESQTVPIPMPANNTSFNRFEVKANRPSQTDIQFHVAVAQAVGGSCSGVIFNFVGPDGTSGSFFTTTVTSGIQTFGYAIPTAINPGQCFRYKTFLSTADSTQTPTFYEITVNYAP